MKLRPGHLLGHGENCNTRRSHRLAEARGIDSTLEDDGARFDLFGVQQKLRRLRRPGRIPMARTTAPGAIDERSDSS